MDKPYIELIDADLYALLDPANSIETIVAGCRFTEGPVWDFSRNCLFFSDIPANTIYSWKKERGFKIFRKPSYFSNGLTINKNNQLVVCEHQSRSVTTEQNNGDFQTIASRYEGKRLNSPNDLVISTEGVIFFSDPIYGLQEGMGGPAKQELPFQGVYAILPNENKMQLLTDDLERPNGLTLSPDEKYIFIIDTVKQQIIRFNLQEGWKISDRLVWSELIDNNSLGRPDGLKIDFDENIFSTGPGGIWIFDKTQKLLGRVHLPEKTSNLAWGENSRKTLFITSSSRVYRLETNTVGFV